MGVHAPCVQPPMSGVDSRSGGMALACPLSVNSPQSAGLLTSWPPGELGRKGTTVLRGGMATPSYHILDVDSDSQRQGQPKLPLPVFCFVFLDSFEEPVPLPTFENALHPL